MSTKTFFGGVAVVAGLAMLISVSPVLAGHGGGGGGGGGHGGGFSGGGGGSHGGGFSGGGGGGGSFSGARISGGGSAAGSAYRGSPSGAPTHTFSGQPGGHGATPYSGHAPNHFNPGHGGSPISAYHHGGDWHGGHGDWHGPHGWDHYFHHGPGWGWGPYWPGYVDFGIGFGLGWGWGWGWGYPYAPYTCVYYEPSDTGYCYSYASQEYVAASPPADALAAAPPAPEPQVAQMVNAEEPQDQSEALQYYSEARGSFLSGDYRNALRLASHAAVEDPQNPKVHELISLSLFALGNYRAAATEAHAAMLGPLSDWNALYAFYNDADKYTGQLRKLEKASKDNPQSAAEHYLLAYHYLMTGARDNAKTEIAEAAKLTPADKLAAHYLKQLESGEPVAPPKLQKQAPTM